MDFREDFSEGRVYAIYDEEGQATDWRILVLHKRIEKQFEFWFYNNAYGVMEFVYGEPDTYYEKEMFYFASSVLAYVKDNYVSLTKNYRKEYMD